MADEDNRDHQYAQYAYPGPEMEAEAEGCMGQGWSSSGTSCLFRGLACVWSSRESSHQQKKAR